MQDLGEWESAAVVHILRMASPITWSI